VVEQLYRVAVCRRPTDTKLIAAIEHVAANKKLPDGFEDVYWALLNTQESLTQH
jgi:hypothetical protein